MIQQPWNTGPLPPTLVAYWERPLDDEHRTQRCCSLALNTIRRPLWIFILVHNHRLAAPLQFLTRSVFWCHNGDLVDRGCGMDAKGPSYDALCVQAEVERVNVKLGTRIRSSRRDSVHGELDDGPVDFNRSASLGAWSVEPEHTASSACLWRPIAHRLASSQGHCEPNFQIDGCLDGRPGPSVWLERDERYHEPSPLRAGQVSFMSKTRLTCRFSPSASTV